MPGTRGGGLRALVLGLALPGVAAAAEPTPQAVVEQTIAALLPGIRVERIEPSPMAGLYAAVVAGRALYVSADGRYLLHAGRLYDAERRVDLSEDLLRSVRREVLAEMPDARTIVYEPPGEVAQTVDVITDIDCPYCRKLHADMARLNAAGVRVRYLLYPRAGLGSESHRKAVSVWCAEDRHGAMDAAKRGETPEQRSCENPVEAHMALAERLGLRATPMTVTASGAVVSGYGTARAYLRDLGLTEAETSR